VTEEREISDAYKTREVVKESYRRLNSWQAVADHFGRFERSFWWQVVNEEGKQLRPDAVALVLEIGPPDMTIASSLPPETLLRAEVKTCRCGRLFVPASWNGVYCTDKCRKEAASERRKSKRRHSSSG
jgi:hypothetical protein